MSELTLTVMRLGFLAVLWLFVIVAVQVIPVSYTHLTLPTTERV